MTKPTIRHWLSRCRHGMAIVMLGMAASTVLAEPATQADVQAQKELTQIRLDAIKESQQKDIDALNKRIDAVDKRIDDQLTHTSQAVDRFGVVVAVGGALVTLLLAAVGFFAYITVTRKTKQEAEDAAKNWFKENSQKLEKEIETLRSSAKEKFIAHEKDVSDAAQHVKEAFERQKLGLNYLEGSVSTTSIEGLQASQERVKEITNRPESSYSFDDWNTRAYAAYDANNKEDAIFYWGKASAVLDAGALNSAKALFDKAVVQGEIGYREAAIRTFDEVVSRFNPATEPALLEQVAKALVNKGFNQAALDQSKAAIQTYDEMVNLFDKATEPRLLDAMARALISKGITQGKLGQSEAAIRTYDEVVSRFGTATEIELREQVAIALVNKGVRQGELGQGEGEIRTYDEVVSRFGTATEIELRELVAIALVLKGIRQDQLGQSETAMQTYDEVIRRFGAATEPALQEQVEKAVRLKTVIQDQ